MKFSIETSELHANSGHTCDPLKKGLNHVTQVNKKG